MKGIIQQIEDDVNATLDKFSNITNEMMGDFLRDIIIGQYKGSKKLILFTGTGGLLKFNFVYWGKQKLPRKLKKRVYLTAKLRRKHIPEYYETTKKD